jgi:small conductance mechanosensitive channel
MDVNLAQATDQLGAFGAMLWAWTASFLPRLGAALLILVLGFVLATWVARGIRRLFGRARHVDATIAPVLSTVARYAVLILVVVAALGQLGVQTTSLLAVLGAAGLAIGLALQGTLSNIAAGIMLLWLRPFNVGDAIEGGGIAGTVLELGLFTTQLNTWDGIYKSIPNAQLWNSALTNYSRNPTRLVLISFSIGYDSDIATGRRVLKALAEAHPRVLKSPGVSVVPLSLGDSSVVLQLRAWAPNSAFGDVQWDLTESGKQALEAAGIAIAPPQRVVHVSAAGTTPEAGAAPALSGPGKQ